MRKRKDSAEYYIITWFFAGFFGTPAKPCVRFIYKTPVLGLLTKTTKTLFESLSTLCFCSAAVMQLVGSKLPPSAYRHQTLSLRISKLSKSKTPLR
jgi:hypothetical protein